MKVTITITPDLKLLAAVDEGTFEEAAPKISALRQGLKALGIPFESEGAIEQHRHDPEHVHLQTHQEA